MSAHTNSPLTVTPVGFFWLNIVTLGIYSVYWGWKAWEVVGAAEGKKYHSAWKGFFIFYTCFSLFPKLRSLARKEGYKPSFSPKSLAQAVLGANLLAALSWTTDNLALSGILSLAGLLLLAAAPLPVVKAYNHYVQHTSVRLLPLRSAWPITLIITATIFLGFIVGIITSPDFSVSQPQ